MTATFTTMDWQRKTARSRWSRIGFLTTTLGFLTLISIPIIVPYVWLAVMSFTAKNGHTDFIVLWRVLGITGLAYFSLLAIAFLARNTTQAKRLQLAVILVALLMLGLLVVPLLTVENYRFLWDPDLQATGAQRNILPSIWSALGNSLLFAAGQTVLVTLLAVPAAYALSRFGFRRRAGVLKTLLMLHAFPVLALTVALFIQIYWMGMLNSISAVILVMCALELPFAIFVRTLLIDSSKMTMSLYLFWASQDSMGSDPGLIAAVGMVYMLPVAILYLFTQKYLTQMSVGGIKG